MDWNRQSYIGGQLYRVYANKLASEVTSEPPNGLGGSEDSYQASRSGRLAP